MLCVLWARAPCVRLAGCATSVRPKSRSIPNPKGLSVAQQFVARTPNGNDEPSLHLKAGVLQNDARALGTQHPAPLRRTCLLPPSRVSLLFNKPEKHTKATRRHAETSRKHSASIHPWDPQRPLRPVSHTKAAGLPLRQHPPPLPYILCLGAGEGHTDIIGTHRMDAQHKSYGLNHTAGCMRGGKAQGFGQIAAGEAGLSLSSCLSPRASFWATAVQLHLLFR